jgi:hypothetical protein
MGAAATPQPRVRVERMVGDQLVEAGHGRVQFVTHGVPLAPGQDRKLAGAEPHRVKALGLQPAGAVKDEVELGRVRAIDHEAPGRAQVGQAVHAAVYPQRGQQLGYCVGGRIVEQLHGSLRPGGGYTVISADSLGDAVNLVKGHPFLTRDGTLQVSQAVSP